LSRSQGVREAIKSALKGLRKGNECNPFRWVDASLKPSQGWPQEAQPTPGFVMLPLCLGSFGSRIAILDKSAVLMSFRGKQFRPNYTLSCERSIEEEPFI
jgi:hypothetical protein